MPLFSSNHDYKKNEPWNTGYFRDGVRRVDLVLVLRGMHETLNQLQVNYITTIADMGFDIEVEPPVMRKHKDLNFVKVHAPEEVLEKYGNYFDMRTLFRIYHMEYTEEGIQAEKEFLNIARTQYPCPDTYSTLERSTIVYQTLRALPGRKHNDAKLFDLDSLLQDGAVWDTFALHDGPYFMMDGQRPSQATARQALYYCWVGWFNLHKGLPIHLIREYFGERIAFTFAFWDAVLKLMVVQSAIDVTIFVVGVDSYASSHGLVNNNICTANHSYKFLEKGTTVEYNDLPVCPKCNDFVACPFRNLSEYCAEAQFKNFLDSSASLFSAYVCVILGWIFFFKWWEFEEFLMWLWEVPRDSSRRISRTRYTEPRDYTTPPMGRNIGSIFIRMTMFMAVCFGLVFLKVVPCSLWFPIEMLRRTVYLDEVISFDIREYVIFFSVGIIDGILTLLLESPCRSLAFWFTALEKHRSDESFERSLMVYWTGISFMRQFSLYYFYALFKGYYETYPIYSIPYDRSEVWNNAIGMNCGVLGCFDELFIVATGSWMTYRCLNVVLDFRIESNDYCLLFPSDVPCWEREYMLPSFEEDDVYELLHMLVLRLIDSTILMALMPLSPFITIITLLWNIRTVANRLLLCRRRPLLLKRHGLGVWRWILALLPLAMAISNTQVFSGNTSLFDQVTYNALKEFENKSFFAEFALSYFNLTNIQGAYNNTWDMKEYRRLYNKSYYIPHFCMYPGKYWYQPTLAGSIYDRTPLQYYIQLHRHWFILIFHGLVGMVGVLLWRLIWSETEDYQIQERRIVEQAARVTHLELAHHKKTE